MSDEQHELDGYLLRGERMAFQVVFRLNVFILPFEDDPVQRWLLRSEDAELEGRRVRIQHCFVTRYGDVDPRVREETALLTREGYSSFESVFQRYWAQEYPDRPLSEQTRLFVLMTSG